MAESAATSAEQAFSLGHRGWKAASPWKIETIYANVQGMRYVAGHHAKRL
jgi:hypothetical protein